MTSRSPLGETLTLDYEDGWAAVNRMIRQGKSWSGRETNCAFWNAGDGTFVDVSHTAGLGFPHDGRSFARVDWDGDGDLDLWIKNRTAPQVQLMRNDGSAGRSLRLLLVGKAPNTEAVGARVEVRAGERLQVREKRLGSGYLGQSSSWLHFGLGDHEGPLDVRITWPDGSSETLAAGDGLRPGGRHRIVQGEGAVEAAPAQRPLALTPGGGTPRREEPSRRVVLTQRVALPTLEVETFDGTRTSIGTGTGRPRLVTFWASWCPSCQGELRAWDRERELFTEAGVDLLALSVDDDAAAALELWERLELDAPAGLADPGWLALFDLLQQRVTDHQRELALPTSFLLDASGGLAVVYRGPVEAATIARDAAELDGAAAAFAGAPVPGRAGGAAGPFAASSFARALIDLERPSEALFYIDAACASAGPPGKAGDKAPLLADSLLRVGMHFLSQGEHAEARAALARARAYAPTDALVWFATGRIRLAAQDQVGAREALERCVDLDAAFAPGWELLGSLRLMTQDNAGAIEALERATGLDPTRAQAWSSLGIACLTTGKFSEGERAFTRRIELVPGDANAWTGRGACRLQQGQVEPAVADLEKALELDPTNDRALGILRQLGRR